MMSLILGLFREYHLIYACIYLVTAFKRPRSDNSWMTFVEYVRFWRCTCRQFTTRLRFVEGTRRVMAEVNMRCDTGRLPRIEVFKIPRLDFILQMLVSLQAARRIKVREAKAPKIQMRKLQTSFNSVAYKRTTERIASEFDLVREPHPIPAIARSTKPQPQKFQVVLDRILPKRGV